MQTGSANSRRQAGFTYVALLIAVAFLGLGMTGAARLLAAADRADKEAELLFVGQQFRQAIRSYLQAGDGRYPANLADLLQDPRSPTPRRHLRRVFLDPITGDAQWGLINAPQGGIMGVHSLSERRPQKESNFLAPNADIGEIVLRKLQANPDSAAYSYQDWQFIVQPNTGQRQF